VIGGLFIALLVLGAAALVRGVPPPPGVSAEEWEWCTEGGRGLVDYAGRRYLGWEGERDWERDSVGAAEIADEPGVGSACRIAFELYGLDQAEDRWCYREERRAALLAPAVAMLGMGEDEAAHVEDEAAHVEDDGVPGDDYAEYTQACRLAYHFWRPRIRTHGVEGAVAPISDPLSHPFLALTPAQQAWCGAAQNRDVLEWTAMRLGIETPEDAPFIERRTAYVRSCRVASIVRNVHHYVRDALGLFSPEVRAAAEEQLAEIERTTGFVGVFVTEQTTTRELLDSDTAFAGPGARAYLEVRYTADDADDCCATVYELREPGAGPCCPSVDPLVPLFDSRQWDEGLSAFVTLVEDLAGEPEPPPRRLPEDPFRES
jgi:hypothetical protein